MNNYNFLNPKNFETKYFEKYKSFYKFKIIVVSSIILLFGISNLIFLLIKLNHSSYIIYSSIQLLINIIILLLQCLKSEKYQLFNSIFRLILEIMINLIFTQIYLVYLKSINYNELIFILGEIKLILIIMLISCESILYRKIFSILVYILISLGSGFTFVLKESIFFYIQFILIIIITMSLEFERKSCYFSFLIEKKKFKNWQYIMKNMIPFGYAIFTFDSLNKSIKISNYNDFLLKIFEIEKDNETIKKLNNIFEKNYILKPMRPESVTSFIDYGKKTITNYLFEKFKKFEKDSNDYKRDIKIIEEINNQEILYTSTKCKIVDFVFANLIHENENSIIMVINDISDRVLNLRLTSLDKFRDKFLQSVSHNLKTPLNSITAIISLLANTVSNPESQYYLNYMRVNSEFLLFEINNILDYAYYRKQTLQAVISGFTINNLINEITALYEIPLLQKKLVLIKRINVDEITLLSDFMRLKQILFNLVGNAVKFTTQGRIIIKVRKSKNLIINSELIKFTIKDTGKGIDKKEQSRLFRLWGSLNDQNLDNEEITNRKSGAGLGLTISKHLIGILGPEEKIYYKSEIGVGSKFSFYIFQNLENSMNLLRTNKKKIEIVPSYDSSHLNSGHSLNKFTQNTFNSQFMINSIQKNELLPFSNHMLTPLNFHLIGNRLMRSVSNFSPRMKKGKEDNKHELNEIFNEEDCYFNKVYSDDVPYTQKVQISNEWKINLINVDQSISIKDPSKRESLSKSVGTKTNRQNIKQNLEPINFSDSLNMEKSLIKNYILIVDDTPFNLLILEKFINEIDPDIGICKAFNGKEALELFITYSEKGLLFNLIFMDCNMPVMDGYQSSKAIKKIIEEKNYYKIPILAVTAYSGKEEQQKCLDNGMDDYLGKPITKESFTNYYKKWIIKKKT